MNPDVPFEMVRRGYDRAQVDDSFARLAADLDTARAAREATVDELRILNRQLETSRNETQAARAAATDARAEVDRLREKVAQLSIVPTTVDGMSERLQQMVRIAQDEVNDMRTRATTSATQVLTLAQAEADELRERSEGERHEFEAERTTAQESLRAQLEESQTRLDQLRSDSTGQKARLDAELAEQRGQAEQELAAEMDQRHSMMLREFTAQSARHRDEAARIGEVATQEARTTVAEAAAEAQRVRAQARDDVTSAHREFEELRALQHQVSEQLTSVRALLDWTLPQIGGTGDGAPPVVLAAATVLPTVPVPAPRRPAAVGAHPVAAGNGQERRPGPGR